MLIRTLIVDDSAFVRKVVREMLSGSPYIEVVGAARDGQEALELVERLNPDVVTCDLLMPQLDGVTFVRRQMSRKPVPIVILTASPRDASLVLDALSAGAIDFVQKPTSLATDDLRFVREDLVQKVKNAARAPASALSRAHPEQVKLRVPFEATSKVSIVVLGISTGGPQALRYLLPQFAADFPVPLVIVVHMPLGYTALFAEKLSQLSKLPVNEANTECPVTPGKVWVARAGSHLTFQRKGDQNLFRFTMEPANKPHRPSVDVLFESAAAVYGSRVLGVVMTGMGDDGTLGATAIKEAGGTILTEAENSCVIYGMPRSVVEAGLSDAAIPLESMAAEICRRL